VIFILNKDFKRVFSIWHLAGLLLLTLTSGGYFYLYSIQHEAGSYLARLFTGTFSRTAMEMSESDNVKHILNFPAMLIKISAPWCLLFLLTFKYGWKQKLRNNPFLTFCFWFCLANGLIYLLSPGTRERYLYMFLPFIYSLLAVVLYDHYLKGNTISVKRFYFFIGISATAGLIGMGIFGILLHSWFPALFCIIMGIVLGYGLYHIKFKDSRDWILAAVLIVLIVRIGFDLVILPTKKQNDPYKTDALKMSKIIKDESIYLSGPPEVRIDDVKFAERHFITYKRNEPTYLGLQTSFYLSRYTGKIVKYQCCPVKIKIHDFC